MAGAEPKSKKCVSGAIYREGEFLPPEPPYENLDTSTEAFYLVPGQHHTVMVEMTAEMTTLMRLLRTQCEFIYFLGYLRFQDDIGNIRSLGFCRHYNPATKRFDIVSDADYEYAD